MGLVEAWTDLLGKHAMVSYDRLRAMKAPTPGALDTWHPQQQSQLAREFVAAGLAQCTDDPIHFDSALTMLALPQNVELGDSKKHPHVFMGCARLFFDFEALKDRDAYQVRHGGTR